MTRYSFDEHAREDWDDERDFALLEAGITPDPRPPVREPSADDLALSRFEPRSAAASCSSAGCGAPARTAVADAPNLVADLAASFAQIEHRTTYLYTTFPDGRWHCRECNAVADPSWRFCGACGRLIEPADSEGVAQSDARVRGCVTAVDVRVYAGTAPPSFACASCKTPVERTWSFCGTCGLLLDWPRGS